MFRGDPHVYFQPPPNVQMAYPAIVYQRDNGCAPSSLAIGRKYDQRYQVTVIDRSPDSKVIDRVRELPRCAYNRFFVADGLNHDVFVLYF
jgi:hypothetical protein